MLGEYPVVYTLCVVDEALKSAERMFWGYCFQCLFSNPPVGSGGR